MSASTSQHLSSTPLDRFHSPRGTFWSGTIRRERTEEQGWFIISSAGWKRVRRGFCHAATRAWKPAPSCILRLPIHVGTGKGRSALLKPQTDAILYFKLIVMGLFAAQADEWRLHCATTPLIVSFNVLCISFHSPSYCLEQKHPGPSSLHQSRGGLMSRSKLMAEHIPFWCDRKNS